MTALTPYDRGERLQPQPWVALQGGVWIAGEDAPRRADDDDFGRVDFDDDAGVSVVVVHVERKNDQIIVHVDVLDGTLPVSVEVNEDV